MSSKILILGGNGFIGTTLSQALMESGNDVIALTRKTAKPSCSAIRHVAGDFSSPGDFASLLTECRTVVHVASNSTPGSSAGRPLDELEQNLRVTLTLLEALQSVPSCDLLFVSSGGALYDDKNSVSAMESSRINPRSYYGAGKAAAEHFISAWTQQFSRAATILRPSNVYGPGQTLRQGFGIIPTALAKITNGEPLEIWGDGSAVRDYLYIDDLVQLCLKILSTPMASGTTILNAGSNVGTSINELLDIIKNITGRPIRRIQHTSRQVDISRVVIDSSKACKLFNWAPTTPLAEGLRRTWQYWATLE